MKRTKPTTIYILLFLMAAFFLSSCSGTTSSVLDSSEEIVLAADSSIETTEVTSGNLEPQAEDVSNGTAPVPETTES